MLSAPRGAAEGPKGDLHEGTTSDVAGARRGVRARARRTGRRRPDHAAVAGPAGDAVHRRDGGTGDDDLVVQRAGDRRRGRPGRGGADPRPGVGAGGRLDRHRRGVLGLAGVLPGFVRDDGERRRDLRGDRPVREQSRAGDADRADARRAGAATARRAPTRREAEPVARTADRRWPVAGGVRRAPARRRARRPPDPRLSGRGASDELPRATAHSWRVTERFVLLGRRPDGSGRDRDLRRRVDRVRIRARARRRRPARAAAPGRLRLLRREQPRPDDRAELQAGLTRPHRGHPVE